MKKNYRLHIIAIGAFIVLIVLGLACASSPMKTIEISENYRRLIMPSTGNERVIDQVTVRGASSFVSRESQPAITASQRLGNPYQVSLEEPTQKTGLAGMFSARERDRNRHDHEPILDQLQNEAKKQYPSEEVSIRNAKTAGFIPTNARLETYTESVYSDGKYYNVERTRTIWDCYPYYTADVITTEPMPPPVTHSESFTKPKSTRADIFRLARIWIRDNTSNRRITVQSENIDIGEIRGTVTCAARSDQTYIITSEFIIDIMDAGVDMNFKPAILRRTDPSQSRVGPPEPIFLKSIADAAQKELVDFSTSLRSYILAR